MNANVGYAVVFYAQAREALGGAIEPHLVAGQGGLHVLCREIDTAGALIEMTLDGQSADGKSMQIELMVPQSMVRRVVSARGDGLFGFVPRTPKEIASTD